MSFHLTFHFHRHFFLCFLISQFHISPINNCVHISYLLKFRKKCHLFSPQYKCIASEKRHDKHKTTSCFIPTIISYIIRNTVFCFHHQEKIVFIYNLMEFLSSHKIYFTMEWQTAKMKQITTNWWLNLWKIAFLNRHRRRCVMFKTLAYEDSPAKENAFFVKASFAFCPLRMNAERTTQSNQISGFLPKRRILVKNSACK